MRGTARTERGSGASLLLVADVAWGRAPGAGCLLTLPELLSPDWHLLPRLDPEFPEAGAVFLQLCVFLNPVWYLKTPMRLALWRRCSQGRHTGADSWRAVWVPFPGSRSLPLFQERRRRTWEPPLCGTTKALISRL